MTYAQFLMIFILPILALEGYLFVRSNHFMKTYFKTGLFILCPVAFWYTTPWDNYLVKSGIWTYEPERVIGRVAWVPFEEYLFFILQTCLTGFWCYFLSKKLGIASARQRVRWLKYPIIIFIGAVIVGAAISLIVEIPAARYLSLILVWAMPVVLLQWWIGADFFTANVRVFFYSVLPPTLYLTAADIVAVRAGVWRISEADTLGVKLFGLPVEEAVFFSVTNIMVCLGLIFFVAMRKEFPRVYSRLFWSEVN